jgi:hypothetical protein
MPSVTNKPFMLSVIMLSVVMLNVVMLSVVESLDSRDRHGSINGLHSVWLLPYSQIFARSKHSSLLFPSINDEEKKVL